MSPQESLDRVAELLVALPGVAVDTHWCADGTAVVYLRTESLDSLAVVVRHATFANSSVGVEFVGPPAKSPGASEAHKLQFRLALLTEDNENDPPSTLQIFGIFLARHLKAVGLVSSEHADDLQRRWNAAVR